MRETPEEVEVLQRLIDKTMANINPHFLDVGLRLPPHGIPRGVGLRQLLTTTVGILTVAV